MYFCDVDANRGRYARKLMRRRVRLEKIQVIIVQHFLLRQLAIYSANFAAMVPFGDDRGSSNFLANDYTRILIGSRLKDKALNWFHSRPDHLEMIVEKLLREMKVMFDLRLSTLVLRREFEKRTWSYWESFCDYFHNKVILANQISIEEDEIDCVIGGIPDVRLRNQARIQRFRTKKLLEASGKLTLGSDTKGNFEH